MMLKEEEHNMKNTGKNVPKGKIVKIGGKNYKSLGGGNFQGVTSKKTAKRKVASAPRYKSASKPGGKGKMTKRTYKKTKK